VPKTAKKERANTSATLPRTSVNLAPQDHKIVSDEIAAFFFFILHAAE
jgi:hypothetical protein